MKFEPSYEKENIYAEINELKREIDKIKTLFDIGKFNMMDAKNEIVQREKKIKNALLKLPINEKELFLARQEFSESEL